MLDTVVFTDPKAIAFFTDEMVLVKVHAEQDTLTRQRYKVMGFPTSVLVRKDGTEVDRLVGFDSTDRYIQTFRDFSKGIGTLEDRVAKFEAAPHRDSAFAIAEKFKYKGESAQAETWYAKVLEMGPADDSLAGETHIALGDMYMRAKEYPRALEAMATAKAKFAGTPLAEMADIYTAVIHQRAGDTTAAVSAYEQFIKSYPESEDAEYARTQIAKLTGKSTEDSK